MKLPPTSRSKPMPSVAEGRECEDRLVALERRVEAMSLDINILRVGLQNINKTPAPTFESSSGRLYGGCNCGCAYDLRPDHAPGCPLAVPPQEAPR